MPFVHPHVSHYISNTIDFKTTYTYQHPSDLSPRTVRIQSGMPRLSGLQRDVLALYRQCLRAARQKPADTRPNFERFARREFERHVELDKKDFSAVEFYIRKGHRQLETYSAPGITNIAG